ncbi:MAG: 30S ribosomal protein S9 [Candidatus Caenarcaniphilales bacterium]|nr:30S ribosomal protein S9 [Candidatus Caenarcaniphilales bacterium]
MPAQYSATGRRKRAIARVILQPGTGKIRVNGRDVEEYFCGRKLWIEKITDPLVKTSSEKNFNVSVNICGGGLKGQAEAICLGIARALIEFNAGHRAPLKAFGLLTRDAREVERKHYYCHKARKMPQYSKR